jgi:hypothetical protein
MLVAASAALGALVRRWLFGLDRVACASTLLTSIAANGATAFLIILAVTFGLILPRMLLEHFLPPSA